MTAHNIENNIYEIANNFAIRIVNLYKYLKESKKESVMSKQLLRSGTSIGASELQYIRTWLNRTL